MSSSAGLDQLPLELLGRILGFSDVLSLSDLSSVARSCRRLNGFLGDEDNPVWKIHFSTCYPRLYDRLRHQHQHLNWKEKLKHRLECERQCRQETRALSRHFFHRDDLSDANYSHFVNLTNESSSFPDFDTVLDSLRSIIQTKPRTDDLTSKYYAKKAYPFIEHRRIAKELSGLINDHQHHDYRVYERGAVFVAQWYQPLQFIEESKISQTLDSIARDVVARLKIAKPEHPLSRIAASDGTLEEDAPPLKDKDLTILLDVMNKVMYDETGLKGNIQGYFERENSFIDKVLERKLGIPITLSIIYLAVAGRLNVTLYPVNFPAHFLLRHACSDDDRDDEIFFVDAFSFGNRLTKDMVASHFRSNHLVTEESFRAVGPMQVFARVNRNLCSIEHNEQNIAGLRHAYELMTVVEGEARQVNTSLALCEIYLELNINHEAVLKELQVLEDSLNESNASARVVQTIRYCKAMCLRKQNGLDVAKLREPKTRKPSTNNKDKDVLFGTGMVMRHLRYHYNCVIYGWDEICQAAETWIVQMGVDRLRKKDKQPFYHVLVSDGSLRYAAQENLRPIASDDEGYPVEVTHPMVGKYFHRFCGQFYAMNDELRAEYPKDEEQCQFLKDYLQS